MTDNRAVAPPTDDWISLQDASALVGVAASTLRRWGDAGRVPMKRTLGGHRRFPRQAIAQLAESLARDTTLLAEGPPSQSWGIDSQELTRQEWHARIASQPGTERMRGLGQRLLGLLIQYVSRRDDERRFLDEAHGVGHSYGQEARASGISLYNTVEAFLFFRRSFAQLVMPLPGLAPPTDLADAIALHARISRFMDSILLGLIAGYEGSDH